MNVVYIMGIGTEIIGQTSPIANKLLTIYGEVGPSIVPSQTLVPDATLRDKVLVKNLYPQDVQTGFTNKTAVGRQLERAINVTNEEEIIKISPIPSYFIHGGFEKYLDASMVYESLVDGTETSEIRSHVLTFLRSCMIGKWRLNYSKPFLPQAQFFDIITPDARRW